MRTLALFLLSLAAGFAAQAQQPIQQLAGGNSHFCSLDAGNTLRCWGRGFEGQLGDGTRAPRTAPVVVTGIPGTIVKVVAGRSHTCALNDAGDLWCMGSGSTFFNTAQQGDVPTKQTFVTQPLADVWSGLESLCAAYRTGELVCVGANGNAQLGLGENFSGNLGMPGNLANGVLEIAFTDQFPGGACALEPAGTVKCWGKLEGLPQMSAPTDMGLTNIRQITAGTDHFCALTDAGGVKCWGGNTRGQLGTGNSALPADVALPEPMKRVAGGSARTCAIGNSGALYCWGYNYYGAAGVFDGQVQNVSPPAIVDRARSGIRDVASVLSVTCVLTEAGRVKCMGENGGNGLGQDGTFVALGDILGQAQAPLLALGDRHSCSRSATGALRCWGDNAEGVYADGTTTPSMTPKLSTASGFRSVVSGATHSCGIAADATVQCWGDNTYGQLGNGITGGGSLTPATVTGLSNIVKVAAGRKHTCAIDNSGAASCWGDNTYGQLGNGTTTPSPSPVPVSGITATDIGAGDNHSCAITNANVACWGRNQFGQLGNPFINELRLTPSQAVNFVMRQLAVGANHACAMYTDTNAMLCWGDNTYGQVNGTGTAYMPFAGGNNFSNYARSLSAGGDTTCAVLANGTTWCRGRNDHGQVGDGTTTNRFAWTVVTGSQGLGDSIALGKEHACLTRADGAAECWGRNDAGQLGDGSTTDKLTRTAVPGVGQRIAGFSLTPTSASGTSTSGLPVAFASASPATCTVSGSTVASTGSATCDVRATQAGDSAFEAAVPRRATLWVASAIPAEPLLFAPTPDRLFGDGPFAISVTQVQGSPKPITITSVTLGVCSYASGIVTPSTVGTCVIRARIAGDATNLPQTILRAIRIQDAQSITFDPLADRMLVDTPFTLVASASSGLAPVFTSLTPSVCTVSGDQANLRSVGTCTIRASQPGNETTQAAVPVERSFNITSSTASPQLTVSRTGGVDPVVSTPAGIDCGVTCTAALPLTVPGQPETRVTLSVTVTDGSFVTFANDDGPAVVQSNPTRVSTKVDFTANRTVTATFTPPGAITVSTNGAGKIVSNPAGIDCGASCTFTFPAYQPVTLTAQAQNGAQFTSWSGGACDGQGATCTLTVLMTPQSATANFSAPAVVAASYQFGEDDPGAAIGLVGANPTIDEIGGTPLGRNGSPVYALGAADRGLGMQFTANQSYSSGTDVITTPSNFVVEAWIRPTVTGGFGNIVRAGNISISRDPDGSIRGVIGGFSTGSSTPLPLNTWTHVALARDGFSRLLIVNGTIVSSSSLTDTAPPSGGTYVGGDSFVGTIDEVRLVRILQGTFNAGTLNVRRLGFNASGTGAAPTVTFDPPGGNYPTGMVVRATISVPFMNQVASVDPACVIVTQATTQVVCDVTMDNHRDLSVVTAPYVPATKRLTLTRTGGVDPIVSTPAGISCPPTCEADFAESDPAVPSTFINLGVAVTDGSFVSATGLDSALVIVPSPISASTKVILGANRTIAFTFSPPGAVTVTTNGSGRVTSSPSGIDCGATCTFPFPGHSNVTLTAAPSSGNTFTRWDTAPTGACSGTGNACTIAIGATPQQITAVFTSVIASASTWRMGDDDAGAASGGPVAVTAVAATGGINLTRNGSGAATYVPGPDGQGLATNFDGVTYFSSATRPLDVMEDFGVALWYKPPPGSPQSGSRAIAYAGRGCCTGQGIFRDSDGTYFGLVGGNYTIGEHNPASTPDDWTHLAFIHTGGRAKFYVNGKLVADQPFAGGAPSDAGMAIGGLSDGTARIAGAVDDVRFFRLVGPFAADALNVRRIESNSTGTGAAPTVAFDPPGAGHLPGTTVRVTITAAPLTDLVSVSPACAIVTQSASQIVCDAVMNDSITLEIVRAARAAQPSTITVARTGSTADPVVSTPAGITCPPTCSAQFPESDPNDENTWITLAVTPTDGSLIRFLAADQTPAPTAPPGVIVRAKYKASPNRAVTVDAVPPGAVTVTLNGDGRVVSSPAGIDCPGTCSFTFPAYYPVTLTATGQNGLGFGDWQGTTCAGSVDAACTFTPNGTAATTLTARFATPALVTQTLWRMGENDGAFIGWNGNGTTTGDPGFTLIRVLNGNSNYVEGVAGRGLAIGFTGAAYTSGGQRPHDGLGNYGASVWVKPAASGTGSTRTITNTGAPDTFGTALEITPENRFRFAAYGSFTITAPEASPMDTWSHVAFARVGGVTRLYVNGVEVGSDNRDVLPPPYNMLVARQISGDDQTYTGAMDDLRYFRIEGGFDPLQLDVRRLGTSSMGTGIAPAIALSPPGIAYPTGTTVRATIDAAPLTDLVSVNPACTIVTQTPARIVCDIVMNDSADLAVVRQTRAASTTTLTVVHTGPGTDPVVSTPPGISCPPTCTAQFTESDLVDESTWVTLAVTPTDGSFITFVTPPDRTIAPTPPPTVTLGAKYRALVPSRTVTVDASPTGTVSITVQGDGRVVSSPPGIDCPGACTFAFKAYYPVTLTATGQNGRILYNWQGAECASATGSTCTFTPVDATARAITASFGLPFDVVAHYRLGDMDPGAAIGATGNATTVDSSGRGLDLTRIGTPQYAAGAVGNGIGMQIPGGARYESATLAIDDVRDFGIEAWVFVPPNDDQFGIITMNGDITYTGYGYGLYRYGDGVYGANAPGSGTPQSGWTHVAMVQTGLRSKLYINGVLDGDAQYGEQYRPSLGDPAYTGLTIGDDRLGQYSALTAIDEVRYFRFAPGTFSVASLNVRRLAATVTGPAPTITYSPDAKAYPTGTTVRVTIAAAVGSQVLSFNPACAVVTQTATQVVCDITLADNADLAITTGTPPVQRTLTVTKAGTGSGTVTSAPSGIACGATCSFAFNAGTALTLTATPDAGSTFTGWSLPSCTGTSPCAVTMDTDKSVTATFTLSKVAQSITFDALADRDIAATPFTVSATASSGLTVTFASLTMDKCTVNGTSVALVAAGTCTIRASQAGDATYDPAVDVDRSFTITTGPVLNALTITRAGAGTGRVTAAGIDCGADCTESYAANTVVTLVALSGPGSTFGQWSVAQCGAAPVCAVTMDTARSVQATFGLHTPARPRADLDGDGKADIVFHNTDGRVAAWLMGGLTVLGNAEIFPAGTAWQVAHIADLDGDGKADLVWQNPDGRITVYLMDGTTATLKQNLLPAGGGWTVTQAADLDGDGKSDLVFQNADGTIAAYLMDGVTVRSGLTLIGAGSGWSITKVGDFDGDGKADVVWTHADGRVAIWLMDGLAVKATNQILNAGSGWSVAHVTDLDGDGKADIVWQNVDGTVAAWLMNGASMTSGLSLLGPGTGWSVTHVGDFDNDGKSDVLWTHTDGRVAIWLMDGLGVKYSQQILDGGTGWTVKRVQDLDADGKADLVWQHTDGRIAAWLMNGAMLTSGGTVLGPGTGWSVAPAGSD